ncbi:DUF995 domain-containing protein [Rhizobium leguminosarum]|jgi:hypothetical protein|uniref:DUF995 domain-containing protein n=1 Tax=Rhizobium leguminosarum bv. viciae TaxID=387 RepID=A0A7G6RKL7_RHILV|nr:DUF995 domain-containing protein [Rhizobium leguminosarum bv. viciae]
MIKFSTAVVISMAFVFSAPVFAKNEGKLPKGAVELSEQEVKDLYVGSTVKYDVGDGLVYYTWFADGTLKGVKVGKKKGEYGYADGTWTETGNTFCFTSNWKDKSGETKFVYKPCKGWWRVGKQIWTKNISGDDQYDGDIYNNEVKKMSKGDKVTPMFDKAKAAAK